MRTNDTKENMQADVLRIRKHFGWSVAELARQVSACEQTAYRWASGKCKPSPSYLRSLNVLLRKMGAKDD